MSGATDRVGILALGEQTLKLGDNVELWFGDGALSDNTEVGDIKAYWDGTNLIVTPTADDTLIELADSATTQKSFDLKLYGGEASGASFLYFDASANLLYTTDIDLQLKDNDKLVLGTGAGASGDLQVFWDGTNLIFNAVADDTLIEIGDSAATQLSFDLKWYGNEASGASFLYFDASANLVYTTDIDVQFKDSDLLVFGTGAGASGDVQLRWDGTDLDLLATADDSVFKIGNGTASFDVWIYGNTASDYILWDASAGKLTLEGAAYMETPRIRNTPVAKTTDYTLLDTDSGKVFTTVGAGGAVNFTLPAVATSAGLTYTFINAVDETMTVTAPANTMVANNDATATSIAYGQTGEQIGAAVTVFCDGSFWYAVNHLPAEAATITIV